MAKCFVGIGSNVGDRAGYVALARRELARLPETRLVAVSTVIETAPVGPVEQGQFLNAVARLDTALDPDRLIGELQRIESLAQRPEPGRRRHWGPRTLDLDLLLYDQQVIDSEGLTVPHPHMHERRFVLEPLAELAPDERHPVLGRTIEQLLAELDDNHG